MSNYRRMSVPGGTYFFTVNLARRGATVLTDEIDLLRDVFRCVTARYPVHVDAMVVLPDHLHAVWTMPEGDADYPTRWKKIKARFSQHCRASGDPSDSKLRKGEKGIWQRRYWEHTIRDTRDYRAHVEYCWSNPVKHGLVARAVDWPYSSIHRDIEAGHVSSDWIGDQVGRVGETHSMGEMRGAE